MIKNIKIILTIILLIFSFYYTNKGIEFIKKHDPLMKEIIRKKDIYNKEPIDAIITSSTIIPGNKGLAIDINKSYDKMKKLGQFNKQLLVYKEVYPSKTYINNYDKIIISGNPYKNNISLIIKINDLNILNNITTILNNHDLIGNYYFENDFLNKNIDIIKKLNNVNILTNKITNTSNLSYINYCLTFNNLSNNCQNNKLYTLLSNININNYHLTYTKNNLSNGCIITYTFNNQNYNILNALIKYIITNNYNIVSIDELLLE